MTTPLDRVQRLREETAKAAAICAEMGVVDESGRILARWDPAAAALVLDLLAGLFLDHDGCTCAEYTAALAVLDALDGGDPT